MRDTIGVIILPLGNAAAPAPLLDPEEEFLGIDGYTRMYPDQVEQVREVRKKLETLKWIAHGRIQAFKEDLRPHEIYQEMGEMQKNKIHIQARYLSTRENLKTQDSISEKIQSTKCCSCCWKRESKVNVFLYSHMVCYLYISIR